jgi:hypothetical protein
VVEHADIIKDEFWQRRPWILSNKPGRLPTWEEHSTLMKTKWIVLTKNS